MLNGTVIASLQSTCTITYTRPDHVFASESAVLRKILYAVDVDLPECQMALPLLTILCKWLIRCLALPQPSCIITPHIVYLQSELSSAAC